MQDTVTAEYSRNCQDLEMPGNQRLSIHTQSCVTLSKLLSLSDPVSSSTNGLYENFMLAQKLTKADFYN